MYYLRNLLSSSLRNGCCNKGSGSNKGSSRIKLFRVLFSFIFSCLNKLNENLLYDALHERLPSLIGKVYFNVLLSKHPKITNKAPLRP